MISLYTYACCNKAITAAGIGNMLSGAIGKAAADNAAETAADQALAFGKKMLGWFSFICFTLNLFKCNAL